MTRPPDSTDFRQLFERAPGLTLVIDLEWRIVAVTDAYLEATMTQRERILGRTLFDVFPDNPGDPSADGVRNLRASLERVRASGAGDAMPIQRYDIRRPEVEGGGFVERYWKPFNAPHVDAEGQLRHIFHSVEDVTQVVMLTRQGLEQAQLLEALRERTAQLETEVRTRKQAEDNLRLHEALLEETGRIAKVGGWSFDTDSEFAFWTAEVARIHGIDPGTPVTRALSLTFYRGESRARIEAAVSEVVSQARPYDLELELVTGAGETKWVRTIGHPVVENGRVVRVRGSFQDITERRQLEEHFRHAQKMEAIGTLAGGIAHDFNNILTAILGFAELARKTVPVDSDVREYTGDIIHAANRAKDLVNQILSFSRKHKPDRRIVSLQPVLEDTLKLLRATIPATIAFDVHIAPGTDPVLADATQIHQVLMNLGTNAWHAMRDRHGRLEIRLENLSVDRVIAETHLRLNPGRYVRITMSDTGTGMDSTTLARIFEPFFTTKAPGEGTGLGLSVVYGIMRDHDGAVSAYGEPGRGSVFRLYFPAAMAPADTSAAPAEIHPGSGQSIAFVDDEAVLVRLGVAALRSLGYAVEGFASPQVLLDVVGKQPARFDVVVTDQTMAGMTGIELAAQLARIRPGLPIILSTGYVAGLTVESVRGVGIRDVLAKPFSLETLAESIRRVLRAAAET